MKEKPKITAEIVEAKHLYKARGEKPNYFLTFLIDTRIRNKGDRGTTIGDTMLIFTIGEKEYQITDVHASLPNGSIRVHANDLVMVTPHLTFRSSYDIVPKRERIPFKLTMPHSHGNVKLAGTSDIIPES